MSVSGDGFIALVKELVGPIAERSGFPFNTDQPKDDGYQAVLYESDRASFLGAPPALAPVWDAEWMENAPCVDLWIEYLPDGRIEAHLEHWNIDELALRFSSTELRETLGEIVSGTGDLRDRVGVIAAVMHDALTLGQPEGR